MSVASEDQEDQSQSDLETIENTENTEKSGILEIHEGIKSGESKFKVFTFAPSSNETHDTKKCIDFWNFIEGKEDLLPAKAFKLTPIKTPTLTSDEEEEENTDWLAILELIKEHGLDKVNNDKVCKICDYEKSLECICEDHFDIKELDSWDPFKKTFIDAAMLTEPIPIQDACTQTDFKSPEDIDLEHRMNVMNEIDELMKQLQSETIPICECPEGQICDPPEIIPSEMSFTKINRTTCSCGKTDCFCTEYQKVLTAIVKANEEVDALEIDQISNCDCSCISLTLIRNYKLLLECKMELQAIWGKKNNKEVICVCKLGRCPCSIVVNLHREIDQIFGWGDVDEERVYCTCKDYYQDVLEKLSIITTPSYLTCRCVNCEREFVVDEYFDSGLCDNCVYKGIKGEGYCDLKMQVEYSDEKLKQNSGSCDNCVYKGIKGVGYCNLKMQEEYSDEKLEHDKTKKIICGCNLKKNVINESFENMDYQKLQKEKDYFENVIEEVDTRLPNDKYDFKNLSKENYKKVQKGKSKNLNKDSNEHFLEMKDWNRKSVKDDLQRIRKIKSQNGFFHERVSLKKLSSACSFQSCTVNPNVKDFCEKIYKPRLCRGSQDFCKIYTEDSNYCDALALNECICKRSQPAFITTKSQYSLQSNEIEDSNKFGNASRHFCRCKKELHEDNTEETSMESNDDKDISLESNDDNKRISTESNINYYKRSTVSSTQTKPETYSESEVSNCSPKRDRKNSNSLTGKCKSRRKHKSPKNNPSTTKPEKTNFCNCKRFPRSSSPPQELKRKCIHTISSQESKDSFLSIQGEKKCLQEREIVKRNLPDYSKCFCKNRRNRICDGRFNQSAPLMKNFCEEYNFSCCFCDDLDYNVGSVCAPNTPRSSKGEHGKKEVENEGFGNSNEHMSSDQQEKIVGNASFDETKNKQAEELNLCEYLTNMNEVICEYCNKFKDYQIRNSGYLDSDDCVKYPRDDSTKNSEVCIKYPRDYCTKSSEDCCPRRVEKKNKDLETVHNQKETEDCYCPRISETSENCQRISDTSENTESSEESKENYGNFSINIVDCSCYVQTSKMINGPETCEKNDNVSQRSSEKENNTNVRISAVRDLCNQKENDKEAKIINCDCTKRIEDNARRVSLEDSVKTENCKDSKERRLSLDSTEFVKNCEKNINCVYYVHVADKMGKNIRSMNIMESSEDKTRMDSSMKTAEDKMETNRRSIKITESTNDKAEKYVDEREGLCEEREGLCEEREGLCEEREGLPKRFSNGKCDDLIHSEPQENFNDKKCCIAQQSETDFLNLCKTKSKSKTDFNSLSLNDMVVKKNNPCRRRSEVLSRGDQILRNEESSIPKRNPDFSKSKFDGESNARLLKQDSFEYCPCKLKTNLTKGEYMGNEQTVEEVTYKPGNEKNNCGDIDEIPCKIRTETCACVSEDLLPKREFSENINYTVVEDVHKTQSPITNVFNSTQKHSTNDSLNSDRNLNTEHRNKRPNKVYSPKIDNLKKVYCYSNRNNCNSACKSPTRSGGLKRETSSVERVKKNKTSPARSPNRNYSDKILQNSKESGDASSKRLEHKCKSENVSLQALSMESNRGKVGCFTTDECNVEVKNSSLVKCPKGEKKLKSKFTRNSRVNKLEDELANFPFYTKVEGSKSPSLKSSSFLNRCSPTRNCAQKESLFYSNRCGSRFNYNSCLNSSKTCSTNFYQDASTSCPQVMIENVISLTPRINSFNGRKPEEKGIMVTSHSSFDKKTCADFDNQKQLDFCNEKDVIKANEKCEIVPVKNKHFGNDLIEVRLSYKETPESKDEHCKDQTLSFNENQENVNGKDHGLHFKEKPENPNSTDINFENCNCKDQELNSNEENGKDQELNFKAGQESNLKGDEHNENFTDTKCKHCNMRVISAHSEICSFENGKNNLENVQEIQNEQSMNIIGNVNSISEQLDLTNDVKNSDESKSSNVIDEESILSSTKLDLQGDVKNVEDKSITNSKCFSANSDIKKTEQLKSRNSIQLGTVSKTKKLISSRLSVNNEKSCNAIANQTNLKCKEDKITTRLLISKVKSTNKSIEKISESTSSVSPRNRSNSTVKDLQKSSPMISRSSKIVSKSESIKMIEQNKKCTKNNSFETNISKNRRVKTNESNEKCKHALKSVSLGSTRKPKLSVSPVREIEESQNRLPVIQEESGKEIKFSGSSIDLQSCKLNKVKLCFQQCGSVNNKCPT